ncbi:Ig-like domain repeat protein [Fimbriiglobus ruber]|uniref:Flagellar hook-length control protein FliK n=1 Tax=Fimbriiglobus ruber TaxID=1908690 RepID=A0A225D9W4_9BACT|nr:Ig-like domain repeat protein [Fimbriiglobus ruber]OWK37763.1 Flagellar hook-length control protein FliK [Fimbriiglobus ruber]
MSFRLLMWTAGRKAKQVKYPIHKTFPSIKPTVEVFEDRTQPASSTTTLAAQYTPVASNVADLLTATVSVPAGATPTGTVAFSDVSNGVTTPLGTAPVSQVGSSPVTFAATLSATFTTEGAHDLTAVYSGDSNFATSTGTTTVNDGTTDVNFSDLSLASNSYWNGSDGSGGFTSGGANFNNSYDTTYDSWTGWAYTNVNYTNTALYPNYPNDSDYTYQYGAYPGTAPGGSGTYAVAYISSPATAITIPNGMQVQSAMFTNTTYAALSMLNGDSFAKKFGPNDWFLLTITGEDASGNVVGTVPFYLANNGSVLTTWQSADLSSLATAKTLVFSETSSDTGTFGMNTPAFFAMDDLTLVPTVSVTSSPVSPVTSGTPVTFTASVAGSPSVGTVTFYAGPNLTDPIGSPVNVVNGTATTSADANLPVGDDTITAVYSGGTGFTPSQGTESVTVTGTTTTVTSSPVSPVTSGTPVTFTASVSGSPSVGTVTFYAGPGLTNPIGSPVNVVNGTATSAADTSLAAGADTVTAVYSGGTGFPGSQGTESVTVNTATTTTVTSTPASPIAAGTPITFTATVSGSPSVGTVTFYAGPNLTDPIGSPVNVVNGTATTSADANLPVGDDTITAVYSGGTGFTPSQGTESVTVTGTTTTVTSSPVSPVTSGTPVTFTASVSGSPSVGTVTFYAGPGLTNPIGSPVNVVNGTATSAADTSLAAGADTVTAVYSGGTGFPGSQGTESVTVNTATTTTVTSSPVSPITAGTSITFTASVSGNPSVGTVTFYAGPGLTNPIGSPVDVVNGTATSAAATSLAAGADTVTAVYVGGTGFAPSEGTESVTVNTATTTTVTSTPVSPITAGTSITFTASVSGSPSVGTVTFYAGPGLTNAIGSPVNVVNGTATSAADPSLAVGTDTITAVYSGGPAFTGSQGTESVSVTAAVSPPPSSPPVSPPPTSPPPPATTPALVGAPQFAVGSDVGGPSTVTLYNSDGSVAATLDPFPGTTGGVRTAVADFMGNGTDDVVVGTGPGVVAEVKVIDPTTGAVLFDVQPFGNFTGGVFVAAGDLSGSGKADLVITPDVSGGPRVEIYEGGDFREVANFFGIDDPNFRGGAQAAVDGAAGNGVTELVVAAGFGGGPRISVYDGASLLQGQLVHPVADFFAFESTLRNGAYVAAGDVNGDGTDDLVFGAGSGGGPRVLILNGATLLSGGSVAAMADPISNFFAGDTQNRDGVRVAVANLDGDAYADVVTGAGTGGGSEVTTYLGKNLVGGNATPDLNFDAFPTFSGGVFVG